MKNLIYFITLDSLFREDYLSSGPLPSNIIWFGTSIRQLKSAICHLIDTRHVSYDEDNCFSKRQQKLSLRHDLSGHFYPCDIQDINNKLLGITIIYSYQGFQ